MIVVAIISLLAVIALPSFVRARKRTQATYIKSDLRLIDGAVDQYALEFNRSNGTLSFATLVPYFKAQTRLAGSGGTDIMGNSFSRFQIGTVPLVSSVTVQLFSDVCDVSFWSPYYP